MIPGTRFNGWRNAQRRMHAAEIVVGKVQADNGTFCLPISFR